MTHQDPLGRPRAGNIEPWMVALASPVDTDTWSWSRVSDRWRCSATTTWEWTDQEIATSLDCDKWSVIGDAFLRPDGTLRLDLRHIWSDIVEPLRERGLELLPWPRLVNEFTEILLGFWSGPGGVCFVFSPSPGGGRGGTTTAGSLTHSLHDCNEGLVGAFCDPIRAPVEPPTFNWDPYPDVGRPMTESEIRAWREARR